MRVYRLVHERELERNHSFKPNPNLANRWNNDYTVAYTSESLALAALEILGGWGRYESLDGYHIYTYTLEVAQVEDALRTEPQLDVHSKPVTKRLGDEWARARRSLALRVPSVRLPLSSNYLINPYHDDYKEERIERFGLLRWDEPTTDLLRDANRSR